jgi:hypothetical protein
MGILALAQEVFSIRGMTEDAGGSITVQPAVYLKRSSMFGNTSKVKQQGLRKEPQNVTVFGLRPVI